MCVQCAQCTTGVGVGKCDYYIMQVRQTQTQAILLHVGCTYPGQTMQGNSLIQSFMDISPLLSKTHLLRSSPCVSTLSPRRNNLFPGISSLTLIQTSVLQVNSFFVRASLEICSQIHSLFFLLVNFLSLLQFFGYLCISIVSSCDMCYFCCVYIGVCVVCSCVRVRGVGVCRTGLWTKIWTDAQLHVDYFPLAYARAQGFCCSLCTVFQLDGM